MTLDDCVLRAAALLDEAGMEPNPDVARLKVETAEVYVRIAELLHEHTRI